MVIGGYSVVVASKESKYYNKVDAKKVNSTKKVHKKLHIESQAPIETFAKIMLRNFVSIHNSKTLFTNKERKMLKTFLSISKSCTRHSSDFNNLIQNEMTICYVLICSFPNIC
jgi:hypothetical protein